MTQNNSNFGIGSVHDHKRELLEELRTRIELETRMDMQNEPSQEAKARELDWRWSQETSAVAKMTQDEALVTRKAGLKASKYLANKQWFKNSD